MSNIQPIPRELIRRPALPAKPDWFDSVLADCVPRVGDVPRYRVVNGLTHQAWMDGDGTFLKYRHSQIECIPTKSLSTTRLNEKTKKTITYKSVADAENDDRPYLAPPITKAHFQKEWIGRPCWIIEALWEPTSRPSPRIHEQHRYEMMEVNGVLRKVDLLGPYEKDKYMYVMSILDEEGNAIPPHQRIIDECQRRYHNVINDTRTQDERTRDDYKRVALLEEKEKREWSENFTQYFGALNMKKADNAAISRPMAR